MNYWRKLCAGTLLAALMSVPALMPANAVNLVISNWSPPNHFLTDDLLAVWTKEIEEASDGRITFTILPQPVTNVPGHWDAIRDGLVDISYIYPGLYGQRLDPLYYTYMPFPGSASGEVLGIAQWRMYERHKEQMDPIFEGMKVLGFSGMSPPNINTRDTRVASYEDLNGLKVRVAGGIILEMANKMNVVPVSRPTSEVYEIISNRIVDGIIFQTHGVTSFRLTPHIKHSTDFPGGLAAENQIFLMNGDTWNSLSEEDQELIMRFSGEHVSRLAGGGVDRRDAQAREEMIAAGVEFTTADDDFIAKVQEIAAEVEAEWITRVEQRGIDGRALIDEYREEVQKVAAEEER